MILVEAGPAGNDQPGCGNNRPAPDARQGHAARLTFVRSFIFDASAYLRFPLAATRGCSQLRDSPVPEAPQLGLQASASSSAARAAGSSSADPNSARNCPSRYRTVCGCTCSSSATALRLPMFMSQDLRVSTSRA